MAGTTTSETAPGTTSAKVALGFAVGAAVTIWLGAYAQIHDPAGEQTISLFFSATLNLKAWFSTLALTFAVLQLLSAMAMWGRFGERANRPWLGDVHRLTGTLALLTSLPVAYHCIWSLGFSDTSARTLAHSLFGLFFYGAFATKVFFVRSKSLPGWALPVAGGAVFTALVGLWLTSSLWFFTEREFPGF